MKQFLFILVILASALTQKASAALLESWENTLDGWSLYQPIATTGFSSSLGVTAGNYSLAITGPAPNPDNPPPLFVLLSPFQSSYTTTLASSSALTLDIYAPAASFGYYLDAYMFIVNSDTGYVQSDLYSITLGQENTITFSIPSSTAAILAASSNPTQIGFNCGGGYTPGNETAYFDNLQAVTVPESGTLAWAGFGSAFILSTRRVFKRS